ncbi:MAG TPA: M13 family metallopeptidase, partial [Gemmatimonadaceae bacterium]|nr:M13 family metallopeptidase [Gemmatimonadaceae bacterium]
MTTLVSNNVSFTMLKCIGLRASALAALCALAVSALAAQRAPKPLDRSNMDTTCAPCTDFYEFADGNWLKSHTIPPDKANLGAFGMLGDQNQEIVQNIVRDDANLVRDGETKPGTNEWKIGTFYAACMDTATMEKAGFKPIKSELDIVAAAKSTDDIVKDFGGAGRRGGGGGGGGGGRGGGGLAPFGIGPQTDPRNSTVVIVSANQGGLILNREDYLGEGERAVKRRADYVEHVTRSLELIGESSNEAAADANTILNLETSIARISIPQADMRDPVANYHKMPLSDFAKMTPHIDVKRYLQQQGAKNVTDAYPVNVRAPKYFTALDSLIAATPVDAWKAYLRWHIENGAMATLSGPFRREAFRWQQVTSGVQVQQARAKQCAAATNGALGEAVGQDWVKRNFSPEAKARAAKMVDNLVSALRDRINGLDWMSQATKVQAVGKLNAFLRKVAYPDKWRDYSTLAIKPGSYYDNQRVVGEWNSERSWARVGHAPDRSEWSMTPPTVNASYSSSLNQIQFPAGILQPPFFD